MKKTTSITMFAMLPFLLLISNSRASTDPVLSAIGDKVVPGEYYYAISVIWGAGGGGLLASPSNRSDPSRSCIYNVIQSPSDLVRGFPVSFSYISGNASNPIQEDTPGVRIIFPRLGICTRSPGTWILRASGKAEVPAQVTTVGFDPEPEDQWFRIVKDGSGSQNYYKIMSCNFCPRCLPARPDVCRDLGIQTINGERRLVANGRPFIVYFMEANQGREQI